jgi:hypothetical protein
VRAFVVIAIVYVVSTLTVYAFRKSDPPRSLCRVVATRDDNRYRVEVYRDPWAPSVVDGSTRTCVDQPGWVMVRDLLTGASVDEAAIDYVGGAGRQLDWQPGGVDVEVVTGRGGNNVRLWLPGGSP